MRQEPGKNSCERRKTLTDPNTKHCGLSSMLYMTLFLREKTDGGKIKMRSVMLSFFLDGNGAELNDDVIRKSDNQFYGLFCKCAHIRSILKALHQFPHSIEVMQHL